MLIYNAAVTFILAILFFVILWNLFILRRKIVPLIDDKHLPFVSVLIPARNEELNIKQVLASVLTQDYPGFEVIALDDSSEDNTLQIMDSVKAEFPALQILHGKPLIEEWTGKNYACSQLYEASKGEWILFTDADTVHKPNCLRDSILIALHRKADLLTLLPETTMISFAEKLIMPMLLFTSMALLPFYFVDKNRFKRFSIGVGPFMMFKRSAYETIGRHEHVKDAIVEDVWLARAVKENGLKLIAEDGQEMLSVRMYRNLKEIWNGFSKNIFAGFEFSTIALFVVMAMYTLLFFAPFVFLAAGVIVLNNVNDILFLTLIQVLILYIGRILVSAKFRLGFLSTILHPIGALMVILISINSWKWIFFGSGSRWKGRVYKK